MKLRIALQVGLVAWLFVPVTPASAKDPLVVFVVRHAEKVDESRDPQLTAEGRKRASELAALLRDAGIQYVHSSDFRRTRNTAAPLAAQRRLKVKIYDPREVVELVSRMRKTGGRHLIVGHSNTLPAALRQLGAEVKRPIASKEYDRLYMVSVAADGKASAVLLRYGKSFRSQAR